MNRSSVHPGQLRFLAEEEKARGGEGEADFAGVANLVRVWIAVFRIRIPIGSGSVLDPDPGL